MRSGAAVNLTPSRHCARSEAIQSPSAATGLLRRDAPRNNGFRWTLLALLLASPALAAPRSIDDCEAIKDPSAYNLCLASFGPVRGQHGATYPGVASEGEKSGGGAKAAPPGRLTAHRTGAALGYRRTASRSHGGRVRMEFTPGR